MGEGNVFKVPTSPAKVLTASPFQVRMGVGVEGDGGTPRYLSPAKVPTPLSRPGWGRGYPKVPTLLPIYLPPIQARMGEGVPQRTYPLMIGQHMEYLKRCGRYASCVHAGGLSCLKCVCKGRVLAVGPRTELPTGI